MGRAGGTPYSVFLDANGALIVNSKRPSTLQPDGDNIGYPSEPAEVDGLLK